MTVICYRDGVMASDSSVFAGPLIRGAVTKVVRSTVSGAIMGYAGSLAAGQRFQREASGWAKDHIRRLDFVPPNFTLLGSEPFASIFVTPDGRVIYFSDSGAPLELSKSVPFHAIGSAEEMATGAMAAGATAEEAVEICIRHHSDVGGAIQVVFLDEYRQIMHDRRKTS